MSFNTRTSDIVDINNDDDSEQSKSNLVIFIYGTCIIVAILVSFLISVTKNNVIRLRWLRLLFIFLNLCRLPK